MNFRNFKANEENYMSSVSPYLRPLGAQEVEDPDGERGVLAVLDELAEVTEAVLLGLGVLLDDGDDRVGDRGLVLQASLVPE